jgi:serine/threonine protein kinase
MAPESIRHRNYSKKSDIWSFGIVGLWILSIFISFHNLMWYFCSDKFIHFNNWEIWLIDCLFSLWTCCTTWTSQRQRCVWCWSENSVNYVVVTSIFLMFLETWTTHPYNDLIVSTEMKDWHQKFLQIVQRNFENWC